jgi:glycosyltransferase involved in cell wall biosynthesis
MMAAKLAGVPVRIHCFTGQVWATRGGIARWLLKSMDKIIALCSTHLLADSASQRSFLIGENIATGARISVLGSGSLSGVDTNRFCPDPAAKERVRRELGIPADSLCLIYVGRMKREKGVLDLLDAFWRLRAEHNELHLLLVGPDEEGLLTGINDSRISAIGYTKNVESYMSAADIICLPSYREGFGSVLIEAASVGLPAVASRIYGITDAVVEGETGLLHQPLDTEDLACVLGQVIDSDSLRTRLSSQARRRAIDLFGAARLEKLLGGFLHERLESNAAMSPVPQ